MKRPFFETLRDLRGGEVLDDLAEQLQALTQAVTTHGGCGSLTLTLEVKPMKGSTEAVVVSDAIKIKAPAIKRMGTVMFPTVEGNLQRANPNQRELPGIGLASSNG